MKRKLAGLVRTPLTWVLVALCSMSNAGQAQTPTWIQSPVNGHWYAVTPPGNIADVIIRSVSWGGHLASIRSPQENDWLGANLAVAGPYWIGLQRITSCNNGLRWMGGDPVTFTNWNTGEPNCDFNFYCSGDSGWELNVIVQRCSGCASELKWSDWFGWCSLSGITELVSGDCDGNGQPDVYELRAVANLDCDHNGVIDACDTAGGIGDCNGNGRPDSCDIVGGTSPDADGNGIPDECQGSPFCFGDGLDVSHSTPCPCGNVGAPGHGCANSTGPSGALLRGGGSSNPDTNVLRGSLMPAASLCIYLQGDSITDATFGDGVLCTGGALVRLKTKVNVGGASQFPESADPPISSRGGVTPGSGVRRYYQTYYRNPASAFCSPATFNVTNGWIIDW